jgi:hypothetical protein
MTGPQQHLKGGGWKTGYTASPMSKTVVHTTNQYTGLGPSLKNGTRLVKQRFPEVRELQSDHFLNFVPPTSRSSVRRLSSGEASKVFSTKPWNPIPPVACTAAATHSTANLEDPPAKQANGGY